MNWREGSDGIRTGSSGSGIDGNREVLPAGDLLLASSSVSVRAEL